MFIKLSDRGESIINLNEVAAIDYNDWIEPSVPYEALQTINILFKSGERVTVDYTSSEQMDSEQMLEFREKYFLADQKKIEDFLGVK